MGYPQMPQSPIDLFGEVSTDGTLTPDSFVGVYADGRFTWTSAEHPEMSISHIQTPLSEYL